MQAAPFNRAFGFSLAIAAALALAGTTNDARADGGENAVKFGYAHIGFNTVSGDLAGPAGTTPPGVQAGLDDSSTLAMVYQRNLAGPWSIVAQGGTPPVLRMVGAGNAAALGQVGSVRAWFPAVLANYTFDGPWGTRPYLGAGLNYTFYTEGQVRPVYTGAFGGTSSTAKLKGGWGAVWKLGVEFPLNANWLIDAAYTRYGIRATATITTDTPGFGAIARTLDLKADPDVLALMLGYRF